MAFNQVKLIKSQQQILKDLGMYQGEVDGHWGPKTQSAFIGYMTQYRGVDLVGRGADNYFSPFEPLPEGLAWGKDEEGDAIVVAGEAVAAAIALAKKEQEERERLNAEQEEDRLEQERLDAEKAETEKLEAERLEAEKKAADDKLAEDEAEKERLENERQAEEKRLAAEANPPVLQPGDDTGNALENAGTQGCPAGEPGIPAEGAANETLDEDAELERLMAEEEAEKNGQPAAGAEDETEPDH